MSRITLKEKLERGELDLKKAKNELAGFFIDLKEMEIFQATFNEFPLAHNFVNAESWIDHILSITSDGACYEGPDGPLRSLEFYLNEKLLFEAYLTLIEAYCAVTLFIYRKNIYSTSSNIFKNFDRVIRINLEKLNYRIVEDEDSDEIQIVKIDELAEKVASMKMNKNIKWRILEFNNYKTTIEEKENILKQMYEVFEKPRKKITNPTSTMIGDLMNNCIRHKGIKTPYEFYIKNKEKWVQYIYDLFLEIFIGLDNKKIKLEYKIEKEKAKNHQSK